jgi:hypothetical protein
MKQSGSDGSIALKRPGEESFISGYVETPGELGILGVLQDGRDQHIIATERPSDLLGLNVTRTHFSDVGRETTSFPIDTSSELRDYLCALYGCDRGALENISIENLVMLVGDELDLAVADFLMANEDNTTDDSGSVDLASNLMTVPRDDGCDDAFLKVINSFCEEGVVDDDAFDRAMASLASEAIEFAKEIGLDGAKVWLASLKQAAPEVFDEMTKTSSLLTSRTG